MTDSGEALEEDDDGTATGDHRRKSPLLVQKCHPLLKDEVSFQVIISLG